MTCFKQEQLTSGIHIGLTTAIKYSLNSEKVRLTCHMGLNQLLGRAGWDSEKKELAIYTACRGLDVAWLVDRVLV